MNTPDFTKLKTNQWNEKYFMHYYNEFYNWLLPQYSFANTFTEKIYCYLNDIHNRPVCKTCGAPIKFKSITKGYLQYCSAKCRANNAQIKLKTKNTCLEKYGVTNNLHIESVQKQIKEKWMNKYGADNPAKSNIIKEKTKQTNLEKYGTECVLQNNIIKEKTKQTNLEKHGTEKYTNRQKAKSTCLKRYGTEFPSQSIEIKEKTKQTNLEKYGTEKYTNRQKAKSTCLERYGVEWSCMRPEARNFSNNSKPNREFEKLLKNNNIDYIREFPISNKSYDFKVGNILIEINPYATHNSTWGLYNNPLEKDYHIRKTQLAKENGFKCIHIWDWDDKNKIIKMLLNKTPIYARKCEIKEVSKIESDEFLNMYHLQYTCKNQKIRIGLYYNNELIQIMTFGKPRYNKNYEYELLRLCTKCEYIVIGGAEKLFSYFINTYKPNNIISYCDNSKFSGNVYNKLGFSLETLGNPTIHWYNGKQHVTDNLLRQLGFDKIFNTNYGKGTSNEELMLQNKFVEIYDCGQSVYTYKRDRQ